MLIVFEKIPGTSTLSFAYFFCLSHVHFCGFREMPSPLVFFSFIISFQGLLAGPICTFKDYIAFIEGKNYPDVSSIDGVRIL